MALGHRPSTMTARGWYITDRSAVYQQANTKEQKTSPTQMHIYGQFRINN